MNLSCLDLLGDDFCLCFDVQMILGVLLMLNVAYGVTDDA